MEVYIWTGMAAGLLAGIIVAFRLLSKGKISTTGGGQANVALVPPMMAGMILGAAIGCILGLIFT